MAKFSINQQYSASSPRVSGNFGRLNTKTFTFSVASFNKEWVDPQAGVPQTVKIYGIPSVDELFYTAGNPVAIGAEFDISNSGLLEFVLNPKYAIHNGVLYEFTQDIDQIIANYNATGLELISNVNGLLTFIDPQNLQDIRTIQGTAIDNKELRITFAVTSSVSGNETPKVYFDLVPWENVNLKENYILKDFDGSVVTILGTDPAGGLPTTGNTTGDAYFITNGTTGAKELHIWDGTQWINNGSIQGPPGPEGPPGPIGPAPDHQWTTTQLQFQKPDGTWGPLVDLRGPAGADAEFMQVEYAFDYDEVANPDQIFTVPDTSLITQVFSKGVRLERKNPDGTPDEWKILSATQIQVIKTAADLSNGDRITIEAATTKTAIGQVQTGADIVTAINEELGSTEWQTQKTLEQIQDIVAAMFQSGNHTNASVTYDDVTGSISISASGSGTAMTEEEIEDIVGGFAIPGNGINITYDDVNNALTFTLAGEIFTTLEKNKLSLIEAEANKYIHPATHSPSIIAQDVNNRFVTDAEKAFWNDKISKRDVELKSSLVGGNYTFENVDKDKFLIIAHTAAGTLTVPDNVFVEKDVLRFQNQSLGILTFPDTSGMYYKKGSTLAVQEGGFVTITVQSPTSFLVEGDLVEDTTLKAGFTGTIDISQSEVPVYYESVTSGTPVTWAVSANQKNGAQGFVKVNGSYMTAFPTEWVVIGDPDNLYSTVSTDVNYIWWHFVNGEMQVVCKVIATTDTTAPTAPTNVVVSNENTSGFDASWTAATDNVGVTSYDIDINGIVTTGVVSPYTKTGLVGQDGAVLSVSVRAKDAAGNVSAWSTSDNAYMQFAVTMSAVSSGSTQIDLAFNAVTNDANIDNFVIERSTDNVTFSPLATVAGTVFNYSDTGLTTGTQYYYRVKATDAQGLHPESAWATANATAGASGDTTPPSVPTNVQVSNITDTGATVTWDAATDPVPDTTAPSVPTGLAISNITDTGATATWNASTDS